MVVSIHGRFQPFHNGHLSYFVRALERSEFVFVGITRLHPAVDTGHTEVSLRSGLHSAADENNPFSFFQRRQIIEAGLLSAGVEKSQFDVIPFPIEDPHRLPLFFPRSGICYTTIKDEWNQKKIELLKQYGFNVEVLDQVERDNFFYASGSQIRLWAQNGDRRWLQAVPAGVAKLLDVWDGETPGADVILR